MATTERGRANEGSPLRFVIIGAGMAGILSAIRLSKAGLDDWVIYEKADRVGGTWRENRYPGLSCDVPSHMYSYSFAFNPDWSHRFAPGPEIQAYFEDVAERYGVTERTIFGAEVSRCAFEGGRWKLETKAGGRDEGDVVIAATGVLHHPLVPDLVGLDTFAGDCFHSARWKDQVVLDGRRVGIIGTGSTAVQMVGALADRVASLSLFQRTAQWIMPVQNPAYSEEEKAGFRSHPERIASLREQVSRSFTDGFANILGDQDSPLLAATHEACVANLEQSVVDPALRERLRPSYRAACKRLVMSDDFYEAIQKPNAHLVTSRIERIEPEGVRTEDGVLHALDVLVLATGFRVDRFVRPMEVIGRDGLRLDDVWRDGPFAYMSMAVPGFPNFFLLNGPNSPVGNFSLIDVAELQFDYVEQLIGQIRSGACSHLEVGPEAMARFDAERLEAAQKTIWATGCQSWYLDKDGMPTAWPFTFDRFREEMTHPRLDDYERLVLAS